MKKHIFILLLFSVFLSDSESQLLPRNPLKKKRPGCNGSKMPDLVFLFTGESMLLTALMNRGHFITGISLMMIT